MKYDAHRPQKGEESESGKRGTKQMPFPGPSFCSPQISLPFKPSVTSPPINLMPLVVCVVARAGGENSKSLFNNPFSLSLFFSFLTKGIVVIHCGASISDPHGTFFSRIGSDALIAQARAAKLANGSVCDSILGSGWHPNLNGAYGVLK